MNIINIQHFSTGDGPGIRTTVFFGGCNLHCPWCHNPEALYGDAHEMGSDEVIAEVLSDRRFYEKSGGGVTLSGGEPLENFADTLLLAREFNARNLHVIIDTALCVACFDLHLLARYTDCFFVDIKTTDIEKLRRVCGGELGILESNLAVLCSQRADIVFRVPLIPGFNTDEKSLDGIIAWINRYHKPCTLLPFHRLGSAKYTKLGLAYSYADTPPQSREELALIRDRFKAGGIVLRDF